MRISDWSSDVCSSDLAEYLTDNVLGLQPPRIQQFLRQTSVLTRLSAGLCDEVTGWQDSQSILLFLERSGLFLRCLDSELSWFKYHTLFSSFLSEQTRSEDPALPIGRATCRARVGPHG